MFRHISTTAAALAMLFAATASQAALPDEPAGADPLPSLFVEFFYKWKAEPRHFEVSDLKVLKAGEGLRVLCGAYDLPGQTRRPFLVLGDATPSASAAWEPGSFPENDPLYPQLMDNLRLCQTLGAEVATPKASRRG